MSDDPAEDDDVMQALHVLCEEPEGREDERAEQKFLEVQIVENREEEIDQHEDENSACL